MPITTHIKRLRPTEDHFRELDYGVMAEAFSIHNTFGKLHDESVYQAALLQRCSALNPTKELPIKVTHETFSKTYYLDFCISGEAIYELKTASRITASHEAQLLNYLFLIDLPYGKIINFRNQSVESRYVSTSLSSAERKQFEINTKAWVKHTEHCEAIPEVIEAMLQDWGTHLDVHLYKDAIHHLLNLNTQTTIRIFDRGIPIGKRNEPLLNLETALHISSIKGNLTPYQKHLCRLFAATHIKNIQWINFAGSEIKLQSLKTYK